MENLHACWRPVSLLALILSALSTAPAWAHSADSYATLTLQPGNTVGAGTEVTLIANAYCSEQHSFRGQPAGHCQEANQLVGTGSLHIQAVVDGDGQPTDCSHQPLDYEMLGQSAAPNYQMAFDTSGLGGQTLGFRVHYVPSGGGGAHKPSQAKSACVDLIITQGDPLPDGTLSYGQGFYGSSPVGEMLVASLIDGNVCTPIHDILFQAGFSSLLSSCDEAYWSDLALFLTGTVGNTGGNKDGGFLPAGNPSVNGPGLNLAAQQITLSLNFNLWLIPADGLMGSYYINVDPVQDYVDGAAAGLIDPVFHNPELYSDCVDDGQQHCSSLVYSELGAKVAALDDAGTSVHEVYDAAMSLLLGGLESVDLNSVSLSRGDMTAILGMINESYDGQPSGFVTAWDVD
ncbi:hypothetical protein [Marinobacterium arenosum]|uniref:hypothetical protein n=1 Tax=Marinobacterium arenosum TaxID=2862496 RepID=UPI001C978059|nr:hypothetical protein [Marinobacterium arenosum]MBY4677410.1 hypothetical protein [Marinobacterium arenosum]